MRKWGLRVNAVLLTGFFLGFVVVLGVGARAQRASATVHANMFAARACAVSDPDFCPGGVWDQAAFDAMYENPESVTSHYPNGASGSYVRVNVPLCETDDCGAETIRCTDGTRPVFYFDPGSGDDADKWIIMIQSGGASCGPTNCATGYLTGAQEDFSSAYGNNPDRINAGGLLSNLNANLFKDYNQIRLDKCVGDRNLGDATVNDYTYLPDHTGPVYFHGFRLLKAVLQAVKTVDGEVPDLEDASLIAFMSHSNGSNGGYLYMDRLREYVLDDIAAEGNKPDVRYLASGFVFPGPEIEYSLADPEGDFPATYPGAYGHVDGQTTQSMICGDGFEPGDPSYQDWLDAGEQADGPTQCIHGVGWDHLRGIGGMFFSTADYAFGREFNNLSIWGAIDGTPTLDQSCLDAHQGTGDVQACNDSGHVMLYHLTTPTFFSAQASDRNLRTTRLATMTFTFDQAQCDEGDVNCHTENFRGDKDADDNPLPSEAGWQKEDYQARIMAIMNERFNGQSDHQERPLGLGHGAFIDNTVDHMSLTSASKQRRTMIPKSGEPALEQQAYIRQWLDPENNELVVCVDDGPLYDVEFTPPVLLPDAPAGLACDSGAYYDPGTPIDPNQGCNDPFSNTASADFACLVTGRFWTYLPLAQNSQ